MSIWSFLAEKEVTPTATTTTTTKKGLPDWFEKVRFECLRFNANLKMQSPEETIKHRKYVGAHRIEVIKARQRIAAALASNNAVNRHRLEVVDADYRTWLHDTADPAITEFFNQVDTERQRLSNLSNDGGSRESYWQHAGQQISCVKIGMPLAMALREEHADDLAAAITGIKQQMADFAQRYASEEQTRELASRQFGRLISHANIAAEKDRTEKIERRREAEQRKNNNAEAKKLAAEKKRQAKAAKASGFNTVIAEPYRRNH